MSHVRAITIRLGERTPDMRRCAAAPESGRCSCGWTAPAGARSVATATMDHLYGDLRGAARKFAYAGRRG